jgi:hypothetical protein
MKDIDDYAEDLTQYAAILEGYSGLPDNAPTIAYTLAQDAIALADRFSHIHYELRKTEQLTHTKDAALKDLILSKHKLLKEIHIHCRMVWARANDA